ncbi:stage III sporulation protein AH [Lysinibacillus fusiformis]|uniref:stage III sporulation protein AH n=1 Tax=Lysinibacillus fusiformis TaxID=28031 RepID=UPI001EF66E5B|nr:stage III sporulation protein AH [Lysinibacillus fusiformis]MCG7435060.1 stage III sporulation protein AH [Lysinibacillus fusiformis]
MVFIQNHGVATRSSFFTEQRYQHLIDILAKRCNRFAFVENRQLMENEELRLAAVDELLAPIKSQLIERKVQNEWETTTLGENTAFVYYFLLNDTTAQFLKERTDSLFGWITPELPEDLIFYDGEQCLLAACSHEGFFWMDEKVWDRFLLS